MSFLIYLFIYLNLYFFRPLSIPNLLCISEHMFFPLFVPRCTALTRRRRAARNSCYFDQQLRLCVLWTKHSSFAQARKGSDTYPYYHSSESEIWLAFIQLPSFYKVMPWTIEVEA